MAPRAGTSGTLGLDYVNSVSVKQVDFSRWERSGGLEDEPSVCPLWEDRLPDGESQLSGQGAHFVCNVTHICLSPSGV